MTCTKCGHPERRTDARFCARCGTKLGHSSQLQSLQMAIANMRGAQMMQNQTLMEQIQYPDQAIRNQTAQNLSAREWPSRPATTPARTWRDWLREILGWG